MIFINGRRRKQWILAIVSLIGVVLLLMVGNKPFHLLQQNYISYTGGSFKLDIRQSLMDLNYYENYSDKIDNSDDLLSIHTKGILEVNDGIFPHDFSLHHFQYNQSKPSMIKPTSSRNVISEQMVINEHINVHKGSPFMRPSINNKRITPVHVTYDDLINHAENLVKFRLKREYQNSPKDIKFIPGKFVPSKKVRKVVLLSTWRSGSTFLGDILDAHQGTFYSFEPLHILLKGENLEDGPLVPVAIESLKNILQCDFTNHSDYINYMKANQFLIEQNTRLWMGCAQNQAICYDEKYITNVCKLMPLNLLKIVRLGLGPVMELLEDTSLDLRVIQLVRDPRGILHSRSKLDWCKSKACNDTATVCKYLLKDLALSNKAKKRFPNRYLMVRYEDLGIQTEKVTKQILKFLELSYSDSMNRFIKDHTSMVTTGRRKKKKGTYNTFRDSKSTTFAWRGEMKFSEVTEIQKLCKDSIKFLQFREFATEEDYCNNNVSVLLNDQDVRHRQA